MLSKLRECLRILSRGNQTSHFAIGQGLYQIKSALQCHLPAAGSSINVDLPPAPEYTLHELEALRAIILDTVDNQALYRQPIVDLENLYSATVAEAEYLSYLLKQLSDISALLNDNKVKLEIPEYEGIDIKTNGKHITISFTDDYVQYGRTGKISTEFEHTPPRGSWSDSCDQRSCVSVTHDRYMGDGYSECKATDRIKNKAVSHREFKPLLVKLYSMVSSALVVYRDDERTKQLFTNSAIHSFEDFHRDFDLKKFISNYIEELYGDVLFKQVGNYRFMEEVREDGRVVRLAPEEERKQVANYVYYHGNDGITNTIPIRLFANLNPFSWDSSDWKHREKRQQLSADGKPVIVKVSRSGSYYHPTYTTLPYSVTILLPVSINYLSATGKPHNTRVTIVFSIGTINNVPMVTICDVTGFETTDSHVRRWYLEKAIIPCLDKLFKGETND